MSDILILTINVISLTVSLSCLAGIIILDRRGVKRAIRVGNLTRMASGAKPEALEVRDAKVMPATLHRDAWFSFDDPGASKEAYERFLGNVRKTQERERRQP